MAAGKGNIVIGNFCNQLLSLIFNGTAIPGIAQNASSPLTSLYVALHTANPMIVSGPGVVGTQTASETIYQNYVRQALTRNSTTTGWTVSGTSVTPVSAITFPQVGYTSAGDILTYFSVGTAATGTGNILYYGTISPTITAALRSTPQLTIATVITEA